MPTINPGPASFATALADETALHRLVGDMANMIEPGDMITLSGGLGAGKTTFARALIRLLAADPTVEVPSPTFTLVQAYDLPRFPLVHADLYRVSDPAELGELGLDDLASGAVVLLEWPDRAGGLLPANRIDIAFALALEHGLTYRDVRVTGYGATAGRVAQLGAGRRFLEDASFAGAERERVQGDASTRLYERLRLGDKVAILMNAPRRPDGPPVRDGRSYSAIARLAEDVTPFVAMANGLRGRGLSAPEVFHADLAQGLLLLEDLGEERVVTGTPPAPIVARYEAAVDVLVALHADSLPDTLAVSRSLDYHLPRYDAEAFLIEAELVLDWYLPRFGATATAADRGCRDGSGRL
jgi:tRNA threonylcarbamoyl adenosine modification protein YjeE